jgi:hypothetical protein
MEVTRNKSCIRCGKFTKWGMVMCSKCLANPPKGSKRAPVKQKCGDPECEIPKTLIDLTFPSLPCEICEKEAKFLKK